MQAKSLFHYDPVLRRLWVGGQRLHHGATGAAVTAAGITAISAGRLALRTGAPYALVGTALMAHDWHDRSVWFLRGPQSD